MGRSCLSRRFMPAGFFIMLLVSAVLVGQMHAQQVIVARETKPEAPKQAAPPPEQTPSESPTPEPEQAKPKSHSKKSTSAAPTLEQMRMAGALAAERLNNLGASQTNRSGQAGSEATAAPSRVVSETPKPTRKEPRSEPISTPRQPSSRTGKMEPIGTVRSTFMESGREQPSVSPSPKGQIPAP
jgi:hypothetical protein